MKRNSINYFLFFFSGFAALVYQVLWVREIGLLIGSTAQAAALTIAVFFSGIGLGGWFWGRRAGIAANCLRGFGFLEVGVALTAAGHFLLLDLYHVIYPQFSSAVASIPGGDTLLKCFVAITVLLPSAFLMGGTLPFMGGHMIRSNQELGRKGSLLYLINTAGGAAGALAAGFFLPLQLGFTGTYLLAIGLDATVGILAISFSRQALNKGACADVPASQERVLHKRDKHRRTFTSPVWMTAFISGFAALGVEVLWTRYFAQVLQNSVYTYSMVLVVFLLALTLGAGIAYWLSRHGPDNEKIVMPLLVAASGIAIFLSPWLFYKATGGMGYIGAGRDWVQYILAVLMAALAVMLVPGMIIGTVLPFMLRMLQNEQLAPGTLIGRLIAVNTFGAIAGSLTTGFVLLPVFGTSRSMLLLAGLYFLLLAIIIMPHRGIRPRVCLFFASMIAVSTPFFPIGSLRAVTLDEGRGETLIELIEGSHATAAVIKRDGHLLIRVNSHYTLGGSGALESERNQALIPLLLHPAPRSVFFLGMGTGITAGGALLFPPETVEHIVVCELLPEVVLLAERHFGPWTEGLFADPRVTIHTADGRNFLRRDTASYDLIISDLFTPWEAGTGNLYTLEHYRNAARRLKQGGMFVQWIPTYQVSRQEFGIIARTMEEAFAQVVLWRGDLYSETSIVALIGSNEETPLNIEAPVVNGRILGGNTEIPEDLLLAVALRFYAGNISASGLFADFPLNTDNFPIIEYIAPRTQRKVQSGGARWLTGQHLGTLYEELLRNPGLENDPYLVNLNHIQRGYILAGRSYFLYNIYRLAGRHTQAAIFMEDFLERTPFERAPPDPQPPSTISIWEE